jgi:hypothetical protein
VEQKINASFCTRRKGKKIEKFKINRNLKLYMRNPKGIRILRTKLDGIKKRQQTF